MRFDLGENHMSMGIIDDLLFEACLDDIFVSYSGYWLDRTISPQEC
jgi:hypothetical protein